jgi:transposase-like protein
MTSFKGAHFEKDIVLTCVPWYVAHPLSYRQLEELMQERGVSVNHATINRSVLKYAPQLEEAFHRRKRPVWISINASNIAVLMQNTCMLSHEQTIGFAV